MASDVEITKKISNTVIKPRAVTKKEDSIIIKGKNQRRKSYTDLETALLGQDSALLAEILS